jgi:hypothetical protein
MTKPSVTLRGTKAAALTYSELDTNFQNLRDATVSVTAGTGGTKVTSDLNGTITLVAGTGISLSGDNTAKTVTINNTSLGSNSFGTIAVSGQSNVVADSTNDTLTLVAGTGIAISTIAASDEIVITNTTSFPANSAGVLFNNGGGLLSWASSVSLTGVSTNRLSLPNSSGTVTVTTSLTPTLDVHQTYLLTDNFTLNYPSGSTAQGRVVMIKLKQDNVGGRTMTVTSGNYGATGVFKFANGDKTLSTAPGAVDILYMVLDHESNWYVWLDKNFS